MAMCEICGKTQQMGNRVSHANNKRKHAFKPNIQKIRVKDAAGTPKRQYVCTRCLKSNKVAKAV
ncbi:MAG TPA: 50S ribosomal protein L28 [Candidatus Sumerlaeota bacterium]|jgi:large subunit ribosomal protein L28|nr:MAG: 50S ribosomal protein L28 [candidate division BRC1 bacterium ADurb.Bin183]HOE63133.1 50S ribosomal protein L28 [Candidatus Sumerlaeota bacterium]HRR31140.1 50S ribosomal protein L28 [Candidatus Sumerlaeia bacterium]HON51552.1 50S ribosomal protein L28 [Candidatus Sumerlaeota bacterium]HOR65278.1 50S ribosomal protein L28 [Candidatus Sumerlaeota bacterium]